MKHQEGLFKGGRGVDIRHQAWLPEGEARAVLVLVHGLAEHSGRYMNVVNRFVPLGYAVCGIDLPGHGRSGGQRLYVERFPDYIETLRLFIDGVRGRRPGTPVFLVGHSMGGLIGGLYLAEYQTVLAGAVLSGPVVLPPGEIPKAVIFAGRVLSVLSPRMGLVPLDPSGVSRDPAVVAAYLADPLVQRGRMTARLGGEMLDAMARLRREAKRITLPLLIVQGGADRLVDPEGARLLHGLVASADKRLIVYEGLYHEVFNEPEHDRVLTDVEAWLTVHPGR